MGLKQRIVATQSLAFAVMVAGAAMLVVGLSIIEPLAPPLPAPVAALILGGMLALLGGYGWMSVPAEKPEFPAVRDYYERLISREAGARGMGAETP